MSMMPENVEKFSGEIMRGIRRMMPKGVKRFSDRCMHSTRDHA
jgi:hypothetical protein